MGQGELLGGRPWGIPCFRFVPPILLPTSTNRRPPSTKGSSSLMVRSVAGATFGLSPSQLTKRILRAGCAGAFLRTAGTVGFAGTEECYFLGGAGGGAFRAGDARRE